jgi:RecA-family ATPase
MDEQLLSALNFIPVADCDRSEWIAVGMGLKESGFDWTVWDEWSQNDKRYHKGECARLWSGFRGNNNPVKAGTIVQMAKDRGWKPYDGDGCLDWNDVIEYDGIPEEPERSVWKPTEDLITYLELLFKPDDHVAYVTNDVYQTEDGKWVPGKGCYDRTASELIDSLRKRPNDLGYTIGDWKEEAGAWIRFNPVDGKGIKNDNVTAFRYALVESDTLSIQEQDELYRRYELPIAALVYSGGKSLHAIVKVDAKDAEEYYDRVDFLYNFLQKQGIEIDKQNRNPSRLSRMPGVTRKGKAQYLAATNIGRKSWFDWVDFVEGNSDDLPEIKCLADFIEHPAKQPPELIKGLLRQSHKMLVSGPPKAGKSFALMELAVAIAEEQKWLGFQCTKGRVLYINLEIDPSSTENRFRAIYDALKIPWSGGKDIFVWNLRGYAMKMDELAPKIIQKIRKFEVSVVILDPIYKVITGDENNASEMGYFCNQFDRICADAGVSMIYCHHHSKGAQGSKKAMDRASGSGVFARDPDALVDFTPLEMTSDYVNNVQDDNETPWRVEFVLREFASPKPLDVKFVWPLHIIDDSGELSTLSQVGSTQANLSKSSKFTTPKSREASVSSAYYALNTDPKMPVTVHDMAEYMGVTDRTARNRIDETGQYEIKKGCVRKIENE